MATKAIVAIAALLFIASLLSADANQTPFVYLGSYNGSGGYNGQPVALKDPQSLAWGDGQLYIGDASLQGVLVLDGDRVVNRVGGAGANTGSISRPVALFWTPEALYISDTDKAGVIAYAGSSVFSRVGPAVSTGRRPAGIWVENNTLWMIDTNAGSVVEYRIDTGYSGHTYFTSGLGAGNLQNPQDIAMDSARVYIADTDNNRIQVYDRNFTYLDSFGTGRGGVSLLSPRSVASDGAHIYVADTGNDRVVVFGADGYPLQTLSGTGNGTPFGRPVQVRLGNNTLFVLDANDLRVYAFGLNWSNSAPALLADIDATNRSVSAHQTGVIDVMDLLNVSHAPFGAPAKIAQAWAMAQQGQYAQASSMLADARSELNAVQLPQTQALRTELQKRIDADWAVIEYYRGVKMSDQQAYQQTVLSNRINDAQHQLNGGQYAGAAAVALGLDVDLAIWKQGMDAARAASQNATAPLPPASDPRQRALVAQAQSLDARLVLLQEQMARLHQNTSLDTLQTLINSGQTLAQTGDYDNANSSLTAAADQLDQLQQATDAQQQQVDNASAAIAQAWKTVNDSQSAWGVMGIASKPITDKLAQAADLLYSQPAQAAALASQAEESAKLMSTQAGTRGAAVGWVGVALAAALVMGIVAFWLLRSRAPRGGGSMKDWVERRVRQTKLSEDKRENEGKRRGL